MLKKNLHLERTKSKGYVVPQPFVVCALAGQGGRLFRFLRHIGKCAVRNYPMYQELVL